MAPSRYTSISTGTATSPGTATWTPVSASPEPVVDLQIVGAGLAGLLAANAAIDAGLTVRLIEKQSGPGGRATTQTKDGHRLNQGPHALYIGGALDLALQRFGFDFPGSPPMLTGARGVIDDAEGLLPGGPVSLLRTSLLSARSKMAMAGLLARLDRIDDDGLESISAQQWIERVSDRDDLRRLLRGIVILTTYNKATELISADATLEALRLGIGAGVRYLDGGWQTMVDGLDRRLDARGDGRLHRMQGGVSAVAPLVGAGPDAGLDVGSGWACRVDGRSLAGRALLIAAGSPKVVDRLTGTTDLAAAVGPPSMASVLDLGLRSQPPLSTFMDFSTTGPVLYYSRHSVARGLAPEGGALVSLARYLDPEPDGDMSPEASKLVLRDHGARAGLPADDIVMERYLHRVPVAWGTPLAAGGGLPGRPGEAVPGHPGLYVAGDWVGAEGLLANASAASAKRAIEQIAARSGSAGPAISSAAVPRPVGSR